MPTGPLRSQLHVDQLLSNVAVKYKNENFIHEKVFPMVPVKKTSDLYRTYNRNWVIPETNRAIGGVAKEQFFEVGNSNYSLEKHALKAFVPDTAADNYDITDLKVDVTEDLVEKIMMKKEQLCAALFTTTQWSLGASLATTDQWITGGAYPILQYDTATAQILSQSGQKANYSIIPLDSYNVLKNHTTVVDRVKYTSKDINQDIIGALLSIPEILVPSMYYDSGLYGASALSGAVGPIWTKDFVFIGTKPASPGFYALSSGYMFQKAKPMVRSWREEEREAVAIEVDQEFTFKVVASLTGYYLKDTI